MLQPSSPRSGVIWITGFSAAGKTTVGRKVELELRNRGFHTIFLDGDDLRSIFAGRWGYDRKERIELARVYFRLCSHLAAQGCTVIISAVAMYQEIRDWLRQNVPASTEFFLDVPEEERLRRDRETKNIYPSAGDFAGIYDPPDDRVLKIPNFGSYSVQETAAKIVGHYLGRNHSEVDFGREEHWACFYRSQFAPFEPSPFAEWVASEISPQSRILEIGCGNGRDSFFFARAGHRVAAVDPSNEAIRKCNSIKSEGDLRFLNGTLPDVLNEFPDQFDVVYSRFVIHAMPLAEEEKLLGAAAAVTKTGGRLYIECRSLNDPMAREGEVISPTERILGHYRRFIDKEELEDRLKESGFRIERSIEAKGLAVYGNEDPIVIRITAIKA